MSGETSPACPTCPPVFLSISDSTSHTDNIFSGILIEGCPSSININDCVTLQETSDPTKMLDNDAPKQRIEFYDAKEKGMCFSVKFLR